MDQFTYDVLALFDEHDSHSDLEWRAENGVVSFFVCCNDVFAWGCSDGEDLTPHNIPALREAVRAVQRELPDLSPYQQFDYAQELFVARVRQCRPQGAAYPKHMKLWPLFDACGPERETGLGNPKKPGEYGKKEDYIP